MCGQGRGFVIRGSGGQRKIRKSVEEEEEEKNNTKERGEKKMQRRKCSEEATSRRTLIPANLSECPQPCSGWWVNSRVSCVLSCEPFSLANFS